jgi:hypothetical protein
MEFLRGFFGFFTQIKFADPGHLFGMFLSFLLFVLLSLGLLAYVLSRVYNV